MTAAPDEAGREVWELIAGAGIRMLRIPTPFQVGRVNCYLLEDEPLTLIDTGPNSAKALGELEHQLDAVGHRLEDIERIVVSHQHLDHLGLVDVIAKRSGAEVAALDLLVPSLENYTEEAEAEDRAAGELMLRHGIPEDMVRALQQVSSSFRAWGSRSDVTAPLDDGQTLSFRDRELEVLHRPGHSPTDTVFWDAERRILFAADHLIRHISSNALITKPPGDSKRRPQSLVDYITSLQKTRTMPAKVVLAGHGEPIDDHVALIEGRLDMHQRRAAKLYGLIAEEPRNGHELALALWGDVAVTQAFLTLSEVIGHVDLLINAGHVREIETGGSARYEATSDLNAEGLGDLIPGGNPVRG